MWSDADMLGFARIAQTLGGVCWGRIKQSTGNDRGVMLLIVAETFISKVCPILSM